MKAANEVNQNHENIFSGVEVAGIEIEPTEYEDLLSLGKALEAMELGAEEAKDAVFRRIREQVAQISTESNKDSRPAARRKRFLRVASLMVILFTGLFTLQPSFARDIAEKVLKMFVLDHITVIQNQEPQEGQPLPDWLAGEVFDAQGERLVDFDGVRVEQDDRAIETLQLKSIEEINQYAAFKVVLPGFLPEGYAFTYGELYITEQGIPSGEYINIYFFHEMSKERLFLQQRIANEETAYVMSTGQDIRSLSLDGVEVVLVGETGIYWEQDGVLYALSGNDSCTAEELLQIARSIRQ